MIKGRRAREQEFTGRVKDVSVRLRLPEDLSSCGHVLAAVHAADGYPSRWPTDTAAWLTPSGLTAAWVAEHASTTAGHVGMVQDVDDPVVSALTGAPSNRLASMTRLFVAPNVRGRKLGAALVDTVQGYAATQGLQLMLDVVDDGGPPSRSMSGSAGAWSTTGLRTGPRLRDVGFLFWCTSLPTPPRPQCRSGPLSGNDRQHPSGR